MKKILLLLMFFFLIMTLSCGKKVHYNEEDYMIDINYHDDYRILQLSDIHLGNKDQQEKHLDYLDYIIKQANPDMIVITGDTFTFADKRTVKKVVNFFESYQLPWTLVFGNHDEQCYFSIDWLTSYFMKNTEYMKFIDYQNDDVDGNSNFVINLKNGNDIFEQVYLIDSNRYYFGEFNGYDCIHENQIAWYERMVNYSTSLNNNTPIPSIMYLHIPLCEYNDAYEQGEIIYGNKNEDFCNSKINSGMFDKIVELDSTKIVCCGHDHLNNIHMRYQGVDLIYGIDSTNRIYYTEESLGGKVIVIHNDHTKSYENILHTYEEVK